MKNLLILLLVITLNGCKKSGKDVVQIRLENQSPYQLNQIQVDVAENEKQFGSLMSGEKSGYQTFKLAYRYNYVQVTYNERVYIAQPIDFVGEIPLNPGKHTYILSIPDINKSYLSITYRKD